MADHLSRLHVSGTRDISDSFPYEYLLAVSSHAPFLAYCQFSCDSIYPRALESAS